MNMQIAMRSQLIAGVALVSAGAIVASPLTPDIRTVTTDYTPVMVERLQNPVTAFTPLALQTIEDLSGIVRYSLENPAPILRAFADNQLSYAQATAIAGVEAGRIVSDTVWALPATATTVLVLANQGDFDGALTALEQGTLQPLLGAAGVVTQNAVLIAQAQLAIASNLVQVLPAAAFSVVGTTVYAADQILRAQIQATQDIVAAARVGGPVHFVNAITDGAVHVATVTEQVTIGDGVPNEETGDPQTTLERIKDPSGVQPSIKLALRGAERDIARALSIRKAEAAKDTSAVTAVNTDKPAAKPKPSFKSIRNELRSAGKAIRAALKAPAKKKAASATE